MRGVHSLAPVAAKCCSARRASGDTPWADKRAGGKSPNSLQLAGPKQKAVMCGKLALWEKAPRNACQSPQSSSRQGNQTSRLGKGSMAALAMRCCLLPTQLQDAHESDCFQDWWPNELLSQVGNMWFTLGLRHTDVLGAGLACPRVGP